MVNMTRITVMNINIIPLNSWSYRYILKQTKLFCCQHPFKMSQIDYFYYEDILFSVLRKEVQISTLCEDAYRYAILIREELAAQNKNKQNRDTISRQFS